MLRLWWKSYDGSSRMKRWIQILLGILIGIVLLHFVLYISGKSPYSDMSLHNPLHFRTSETHHLWLTQNDSAEELRSATYTSDASLQYYNFPFILNQPAVCKTTTELVMVVITAVNNFEERQAVRDTWGSYAADPQHNTSLVFLLGRTSSQELQNRLVNESDYHQDIIQSDFVDSYNNLTVKSIVLLNWVTKYCNSSAYVLKADDDMFINVENLISALRKESDNHSLFVMGFVFEGAKPVQNKNSKWYTPLGNFKEKVYPRYASGTAYSLTTSAASQLYKASKDVPFFWLEDIYVTGLCSRKAGVPVVHHAGFSFQRKTDVCYIRKAISSHKITAPEKYSLFKQIYDSDFICKN